MYYFDRTLLMAILLFFYKFYFHFNDLDLGMLMMIHTNEMLNTVFVYFCNFSTDYLPFVKLLLIYFFIIPDIIMDYSECLKSIIMLIS